MDGPGGLNVPPTPKAGMERLATFSDSSWSYRNYVLMLQNSGNVGGRNISLKEYNYEHLENWFLMLDELDRFSDAVPLLAAYYFGAVEDAKNPDKLNRVFDYLAVIGQRPEGEKWRWLAHAVYLARHVQKDEDKALELAYLLAANKNPDMPIWARQMPAFILETKGQNDKAYDFMLGILKSNIDELHAGEINFMMDYICNTLFEEYIVEEKPEFCRQIEGD